MLKRKRLISLALTAIMSLASFSGMVSAERLADNDQVTNPSFESGTSSWTNWEGNFDTTTDTAYTGSRSARIWSKFTGQNEQFLQNVKLRPLTQYKFSAKVRIPSNQALDLTLQLRDNSGLTNQDIYSTTVAYNASDRDPNFTPNKVDGSAGDGHTVWKDIEFVFSTPGAPEGFVYNTPSTFYNLCIYFQYKTGGNWNRYVYIDDVSVKAYDEVDLTVNSPVWVGTYFMDDWKYFSFTPEADGTYIFSTTYAEVTPSMFVSGPEGGYIATPSDCVNDMIFLDLVGGETYKVFLMPTAVQEFKLQVSTPSSQRINLQYTGTDYHYSTLSDGTTELLVIENEENSPTFYPSFNTNLSRLHYQLTSAFVLEEYNDGIWEEIDFTSVYGQVMVMHGITIGKLNRFTIKKDINLDGIILSEDQVLYFKVEGPLNAKLTFGTDYYGKEVEYSYSEFEGEPLLVIKRPANDEFFSPRFSTWFSKEMANLRFCGQFRAEKYDEETGQWVSNDIINNYGRTLYLPYAESGVIYRMVIEEGIEASDGDTLAQDVCLYFTVEDSLTAGLIFGDEYMGEPVEYSYSDFDGEQLLVIKRPDNGEFYSPMFSTWFSKEMANLRFCGQFRAEVYDEETGEWSITESVNIYGMTLYLPYPESGLIYRMIIEEGIEASDGETLAADYCFYFTVED